MAETDLVATRGDTNTYQVTAFKPPPNQAQALDLTGASLWFSVRRSLRDADPLIQKTVGVGIVVAAPVSGLATISLSPADTAALAPGPYVYDVQVKEPSGRVTTIVQGVLDLAADVTLVTT